MPLQVKHNGSTLPVLFKELNKDESKLCCECGTEEPLNIDIPYVLSIDTEYNPSDFQIDFLIKSDIRENDIYQVYDKSRDERIGWCFPVQALVSRDHSYSTNPHFLKYVYVAIISILQNCPDNIFKISPKLNSSYSININEFFHEATSILVISKRTLPEDVSFNLKDWLPSLFLYGYAPLIERDPIDLAYKVDRIINERLNIQQISSFIENKQFIEHIYSNLITYERNPLLCFFYLYQIIELLLEQIFKNEQAKFVTELTFGGPDSIKTKEILGKIQEYSADKKRLNLLFIKYVRKLPSHEDLRDSCNAFLRKIEREEGASLNEYIYRIRNVLFHQFRDISEDSLLLLNRVKEDLIPFSCELLNVFCINEEIVE